jgi:putative nucleotidyltransferase with HDIG domain
MDPEGSAGLARRAAPRPLLRGRRPTRRQILDFVFSSHWAWAVLLTLGFTVLIAPGLSFEPARYTLGDIASTDIKAPYDFSYEDQTTTEARRDQAAAGVPAVYDFNGRAAPQARARIASGFERGREIETLKSGATPEPALAAVREAMDVALDESEFAFLLRERFRPELEQVLSESVVSILERDIVASKERLLASGEPITRRAGAAEAVLRDLSGLLSVDQARRDLAEQIAAQTDLSPSARRTLAELGARFIEPTLTFSFAETERRRADARAAVEPVYFQVKQGRVIVRAGDPIDENVLRQLRVLSEHAGRRWRMAGGVGALILSALLLWCLWELMRPAGRTLAWKSRSFALVGTVIWVHLAIARVVFFLAEAVGSEVPTPPFSSVRSYSYAIPFAAVALLVSLLESRSAAVLSAVVFALALGLMTGGDLPLAVLALLSGLAAVLGFFQYKQRTALIKAGFLIGVFNLVTVLGLGLLTDRYRPLLTLGFDLLCAFLGGPAVAIVISFLLPAFESLFERTTEIKLLELSNHNLPLLRRLALEAPGTYHHSVVVGTLAEAAAETIGANATLCRTAALYHDIGKLKKVDYFIENQFGGGNRHDRLSPRMSALIIASHVKEGIEMAREGHLPSDIIDIIPQHHGTKLITYFYEKAKESQDPSLGEVSEAEFRYPGPKPQTKEAGIVMIADAVEAASRTLEDPSPARLKGVIRQIIDYIFLDGQLDECDLTLRDLEKISQAFLRVLMGIHHHRVSYPGFDFERRVEPAVVQSGR